MGNASEPNGAGEAPPPVAHRERFTARHLTAAAALLGASAVLSRLLGWLREVAIATQLGAGPRTDAYYAAFMIPDLMNYLLAGGAMAVAFIPLYSRVLERDGSEAAERLFANVLGLTTLAALALTGVLWLEADRLVALQFPRFDPETQALAAHLTRIVLPAQLFFLTGGIVRAVLMAHGRFLAQAVAPLLYNGAIIVAGVATGRVEGFAWGVLVGACLGPWLVPLIDLRGRARLRLRFSPRERLVRTYLWIALPLMLGISLTTVDEWYDKWFGGLLAEGTVASLAFALKLMQVPVAIIGQAVAAAALPTLSRLWAAGRIEGLHRTMLRTLQTVLTLAVLASAAGVALSGAVVQIVYQYGRFTAADTQRVAPLFAIFALGVPGWVVQQVAVRAFFAREDSWRPMWLSTAVALAALPLYWLAAQHFGARGLAGAGATAMTVNAIVTLLWARRLHGGPSLRAFFSTGARALAVCVPAALVAIAVQPAWPGRLGALLDLAAGGAAFATVAVVGVWIAGDPVMREALRGLVRQMRPRATR